MTLFSPDAKIFILQYYRLVWKPTFVFNYRSVWRPNFILPFGLRPDFIITFSAVAEENLGFTVHVGIFHFLTEKVNFILPLGPEANFHITVWSGVRISYYRSVWDQISYYRPRIFCVR
jgi:hypothetical protein